MSNSGISMRKLAAPGAVLGLAVLLAMPASARAATILPPGGIVLTYRDSDGPGQIRIRETGDDPATGGTRITVHLSQNGWVYDGSGFHLLLHPPPLNSADVPAVYVVGFTVRSTIGTTYQFRGLVEVGGFIGNRFAGKGRYERAGTGVDLDDWSFSNY